MIAGGRRRLPLSTWLRVARSTLTSIGFELKNHGFFILRIIFHAQPKISKVPSNMSPAKFPVTGRKPIVAPNEPSSRTVPPMFATSRSNLTCPVPTLPVTVSVTRAGLHRPVVAGQSGYCHHNRDNEDAVRCVVVHRHLRQRGAPSIISAQNRGSSPRVRPLARIHSMPALAASSSHRPMYPRTTSVNCLRTTGDSFNCFRRAR